MTQFKSDSIFRASSEYCPHHVSHYLGMDVHDTAHVPRNIPLRPGMVITVEPGLYISKSSKCLPPDRDRFYKTQFRPKTFRINLHPHIFDKFPPTTYLNICENVGQ
jgi:hypothetical protein